MASTEDTSQEEAIAKSRHYSVLFVCWGNICRSPIAEAVFLKLLDERGIAERWTVDSAGTGEWNIGDPPDSRALEILRLHGLKSNHRARVVTPKDGSKFDYIVCMDNQNVSDVKELIPGLSKEKIYLLGEYDPDLSDGIISDPYYASSVEEFERVYEICERACKRFLESVYFDYV